jgi:Flp pilus assembly protein TadG
MTDCKIRWHRTAGHERGSSTVELLFVIPILFLMFAGIFECSRAWLTVSMVASAAREGARVGVRTPTTGSNNTFNAAPALTQIDSILSGAGLSAGATRSVACASPCQPDSQVTSTVSVPFTTIIPALDAVLGTVNVTETAVMRYE